MQKILFILALSLLYLFSACAALIPEKSVTLINLAGEQYTGVIKYSDGYSGVLTIAQGPNGESFSGNFVVVDQTSINKKQGSIVVPQNNQLPAIGGINQASSGEINANGYWYGIGNKGTKIEGAMTIGIGGHGHGICKDNNGNSYKILF
jgi:hypothetical protein